VTTALCRRRPVAQHTGCYLAPNDPVSLWSLTQYVCVCAFTNSINKTVSELLVQDALALPMLADCTSASIPSARWHVGALEVSSSLLVVEATR